MLENVIILLLIVYNSASRYLPMEHAFGLYFKC